MIIVKRSPSLVKITLNILPESFVAAKPDHIDNLLSGINKISNPVCRPLVIEAMAKPFIHKQFSVFVCGQ